MRITAAFVLGSFVGSAAATFIIGSLLSSTPGRKPLEPLPSRTLGGPTFHVGGSHDAESWTESHI